MSRVDPNQGLMPSVLDRLTDPDSGGTSARRGYGVDQMFAAVQRDLEELFNTRQSSPDLPQAFAELEQSLLTYGLPDFTSLNAVTPQQCQDLAHIIETAIARFEPRLRDIRATMVDSGDNAERRVTYRVQARLRVDPAPDVPFDTILDLTTGRYSVKPSET